MDQDTPCVTPSPHTLCSSGTPIPPLLHAPVPRPVVHVRGAGAYCRLCEEFQAGQHHPDKSWWTGCVALPWSGCLGYIQHFACSRHNMFAEHITLCWPWCSPRLTPIAISSARSCPIGGLKETLPHSSYKILLNRTPINALPWCHKDPVPRIQSCPPAPSHALQYPALPHTNLPISENPDLSSRILLCLTATSQAPQHPALLASI